MSTLAFVNGHLTVNSVDLSDHVKSMTLTYKADELDDTRMGHTAHARIAGLKDWSLQVNFAQDFAASKVDATLFPLVGAAAFAVACRPVNTTIAATNPEFQGNALLLEYSPIDGAVVDYMETGVTFTGSGDLTRDVTA